MIPTASQPPRRPWKMRRSIQKRVEPQGSTSTLSAGMAIKARAQSLELQNSGVPIARNVVKKVKFGRFVKATLHRIGQSGQRRAGRARLPVNDVSSWLTREGQRPRKLVQSRAKKKSFSNKSSLKSCFVKPSEIRFSQESISLAFQDGHSLQDTKDALASGELQKRDIPPIRIVKTHRGNLVCHDNRRLHMYKALEKEGLVGRIKAHITKRRIPSWKLSSLTHGLAVKMRAKRAEAGAESVNPSHTKCEQMCRTQV